MVVLQPVATALVRLLAPLGVDPLALVTVHSVMGVAAAAAIAAFPPPPDATTSTGWLVAAGLLAAKALLDNVDGGLARATGRVTRMGRYYDTGMDLVVNAAVFAALAWHVGAPLAVAGLVASTAVLSLDFNMERLYRRERTVDAPGPLPSEPPRGAPEPIYRLFEGLYRRVLAPQDRWIERADRALFRRVEGAPFEAAPLERRLAWSDLFSTATLVDLGLSTQTLVLAGLLVAGVPGWFPWACLAGLGWALGVQVRRLGRYAAYRRAEEVPLP
jgi:phosphatidylglycerophosphate synthase